MAVKQNLIANYAGNAWIGLMGVAFVPIYLRYIGTEGYGLVGFFAMITTVLTILDGGFGVAASRELAVGGGSAGSFPGEEALHVNDLIRTLEWAFWGVATCLGSAMILLSSVIAAHWLRVQQIDGAVASSALRLMGIAVILQWPTVYYRGCIIGLQRQIGLNVIGAAMATLKGVGAILVLWLISPTVEAFFAWQIAAALVNVVILRQYLWRAMPPTSRPPRFAIERVRKVGHFAAGVGLTNVLALVLTQIDKILLSKLLPLSLFGYYTLAATLSGLVYQFIGPVFNAYYPRLNQVVVSGTKADLTLVYRRACQIMALSTVPISMLMAFFARDMVWVWTGNAQLAENIRWVVACLAIGTMFNGLMTIPYALQLANKWTMLAFAQNVIAVCLLVPLIWLFATRFGLIGAAAVWPLLNIGYVLIGAPVMYRRLLPAEKHHWFTYGVFVPVGACASIMWAARFGLDAAGISDSRPLLVAGVALVFVISLLASAILMPEIRPPLTLYMNRRHS